MITTCCRTGCNQSTRTPFTNVPVYCSPSCETIDVIAALTDQLDPADSDTKTVSAELQAAIVAAEDPTATAVVQVDMPTNIFTSMSIAMPTDAEVSSRLAPLRNAVRHPGLSAKVAVAEVLDKPPVEHHGWLARAIKRVFS